MLCLGPTTKLFLDQQEKYESVFLDEKQICSYYDYYEQNELKQTRQSILSDFERSGESEPGNKVNFHSLSIIFNQQGNYEKAIEYCEKAWMELRKDTMFCALAGQLCFKVNKYAECQICIQEIKRHLPSPIHLRILLIETMKKCGKQKEARLLLFEQEKHMERTIENYIRFIELFDLFHEYAQVLLLIKDMRRDYPEQSKLKLIKEKIKAFELIANHKVGNSFQAALLYVQVYTNLAVDWTVANSSQYFNLLKVVPFSYETSQIQKGRNILVALYSFRQTRKPTRSLLKVCDPIAKYEKRLIVN